MKARAHNISYTPGNLINYNYITITKLRCYAPTHTRHLTQPFGSSIVEIPTTYYHKQRTNGNSKIHTVLISS